MARHEEEREDLLREATALTQRAEWRVPGQSESVVVGFRSTGAMSIYFGSDPVYQFDSQGQLRRAFVDGRLYRSSGTGLAQLVRDRGPDHSHLLRTDLEPHQLSLFLEVAARRLRTLRDALFSQSVEVVGQVPPESDLRPRVGEVLTLLVQQPLTLSPPLVKRRESLRREFP